MKLNLENKPTTDSIIQTFKALNERIMAQETMLQTLVNITLKSKLCTEKELETEFNRIYDELEKSQATSTSMDNYDDDDDDDEESLAIPYYGPMGIT